MKKIYYPIELLNWLRIRRRLGDSFYTTQDIVELFYAEARAYRATETNLENLFSDGEIEKCDEGYRGIKCDD